jgi:hypothetical protein
VSKVKIDPAAYNRFLRDVQPRDARLVRSVLSAPERSSGARIEVALKWTEARFEVEPGGFRAWQGVTFLGTLPTSSEPLLRIEAEFEVGYTSSEPMTDEIFAVFRKLNLPLNLWPYLREYVHQMLLRAGWPPFVLPAFQSEPRSRRRSGAKD